MASGLVRGVVTQNVDGFHAMLSPDPFSDSVAELHGCLYVERCRGDISGQQFRDSLQHHQGGAAPAFNEGCGRRFRRTFDVGTAGFAPTGRMCPYCGGVLVDGTVSVGHQPRHSIMDKNVSLKKTFLHFIFHCC